MHSASPYRKARGRCPIDWQPAFAYSSGQISSHDNGWEGFAEDNPYVAQGSRCIFGYGSLFSGLVPIWVAGEEFNAPFKALPELSSQLFGGANPGQGKWLYGGEIQWEALEQPEHRAMFEDVKRLIVIRKREADILGAVSNQGDLHLVPLESSANAEIPQPYARVGAGKAVLVVGNHTDRDVNVTIRRTLQTLGLAEHAQYRLTNLWDDQSWQLDADALGTLQLEVQRDKVPQGGLALIKIEPV